MPPSRAAIYQKWNYNFVTYWGIEDHDERQQHLLNYFINCGIVDSNIQNITLDVMMKLCDDDVLQNPFKLGTKSVHLEKNLHLLRQCVTAEMLFICGAEKHTIKKWHVAHKANPLKEKQRCEEIIRLSNQVNFSCALTPYSKFLTDQRAKKNSKNAIHQNADLHKKPYSTILHNLSPERLSDNDMDLVHYPAFTTIREVSPETATKSPSSHTVSTFSNRFDEETDVQDKYHHQKKGYQLEHDLNMIQSRSRTTSLGKNCFVTTAGNDLLPHIIAVTPTNKTVRCTSTVSAVHANKDVEQNVAINRDHLHQESINQDSTRNILSSILPSARCISDIQNDASDSNNVLLNHHLTTDEGSNQDMNYPSTESIPSEKNNSCECFNDSSSSEHDGDEVAALFIREENNTINKYGLNWSISQNEVKIKHDTVSRKAKALLKMLNDLTRGDIVTAQAVLQNLQTRFQSCCMLLPDNKNSKVSENEDKKECNVDKAIINNIKRFITLPQNQTKGTRKIQVQQALLAILTSIVGPTHGYCSTPFGEGEVISVDKLSMTYKVEFPWGATMYCHQTEMEKYNHNECLPLTTVAKKLGLRDRHILYMCRELRNSMLSGRKQPFEILVTKPKTRWDYFGNDFQYAIHSFCHDPDYVHPDNY